MSNRAARQRGKAFEREVAREFGCARVCLSGGNNRQADTRSDTTHPVLYIEAKTRASMAVWSLYRDTEKKAGKEDKVPVLALKEKGKAGWLIACRPDDLATVARQHAAASNVAAQRVLEKAAFARARSRVCEACGDHATETVVAGYALCGFCAPHYEEMEREEEANAKMDQ